MKWSEIMIIVCLHKMHRMEWNGMIMCGQRNETKNCSWQMTKRKTLNVQDEVRRTYERNESARIKPVCTEVPHTLTDDRPFSVMFAMANLRCDNLFVSVVHTSNLIYFPSHNLHNLIVRLQMVHVLYFDFCFDFRCVWFVVKKSGEKLNSENKYWAKLNGFNRIN